MTRPEISPQDEAPEASTAAAEPAPASNLQTEAVLVTAEDTRAAGRALAGRLRAGDVLVLSGELGAGKTTFTQGLAEGLKVRGPITSPTFVISRVHPSLVEGPELVHVDAYRLAGGGELEDIDLDATVPTSITVVEWGVGVAEQLSDSWLLVELERRTGAETTSAPTDVCSVNPEDDSGSADAPDEVTSEVKEPVDPRLLRITGHGPRWQGEAAGLVGVIPLE